jgi:hypothetical protein
MLRGEEERKKRRGGGEGENERWSVTEGAIAEKKGWASLERLRLYDY